MTFAQRCLVVVSVVVGFSLCGTAEAQDPAGELVPVVVAVDTSRSLDATALDRTRRILGEALDGLPANVPVGVLAFDDTPNWLRDVGASPADAAAALDALQLQGNYTLLYDALFVVSRALPDGGAVLLATDGRDENSAVVVDDIARLAEAQNVRVVAVGTGAPIQEKALRRLALISNGSYVGPIDTVDAAAITSEVEAARAAITAERAEAAAPEPQAPVQPRPLPTPVETPAPTPWWLNPLAWLAGLLAIGLVAAVIGLARRRQPIEIAPLAEDEPEVDRSEDDAADEAEAGMVRLELAQTIAATPREAPEVTVDTAVFQQMSLDERLERTRVLSNHSVLLMRKLGEPPRTFLLDGDKAFAVGRDRHKNTLPVPDPALSAQHFKIVPRDDVFFFVDLESTNGSFVNGRKIGAKRLRHGDTIRAGQVEFEYQDFGRGRAAG